ncbi:IS3 family transposase, partial [Brevibacillus porteri]|uniref:IS3 family transposase n=1 Tax=Brevibacillus porteri TaxID=2126350 RepID=UPI00399C891F
FVKNRRFESLAQLKQELGAYVKWFNETRIHSTLGYLSPFVLGLSKVLCKPCGARQY